MSKTSLVTGAVMAAAMLTTLSAAAQGPGQMPPKQVGVVEVTSQEVPRRVTLPGRAVAASETAIRPRVGGIITEILYRPGQPIEAGTAMFRIEDRTYQANLAIAQAEVTSARAQVTQAQSSFDRTEQLQGSGTTQSQVEEARATLDQALAAQQSAEADLTLAEADLEWTTVTSPISGIASVSDVSVGDLVTAGQSDAMATVTQLDPIEVDMYEPSSRILSVLDDINDGSLRMNDQLNATLTLENGREYQAVGKLVAPGVTVSTSTGSIDTRFRFDNPDNLLLPGMFLRGQIELGMTSAILVSQSAASRDKIGTLSAWVVVDGTIAQRQLTEEGTYQHQWIVTGGLEDGDMLVVDGLAGLADGMDVISVPVSFDDTGVVREAEPAGGAAAGVPPTGAQAGGAAAPASDAPADNATPGGTPTGAPADAPATE
ncbi:efflux RND transporter periplasmic adaptor subunit (plasmid) [Paracoccus liaowanqingii]|uniref:Efflux RND transporter periplasmic adaptor subunit n=1 Tax=Paracoccus liaowanqingii TaxID=2560053 RepID=A0A4Y5SSP7_9RHOB|nr:efflux RND transporter periplasmic adaptor subunit [Paracoccus liaowanqingii]QDA35826.1 efflux RND transporter periplasmic adaptor subunit [Paracoccus liaowanqingii]